MECCTLGFFIKDIYLLYSYGLLIYKWKWKVISLWMLILLVSLPAGPMLMSELSNGFGRVDTEAQQGLDILDDQLGFTQSSVLLVLQSKGVLYTDEDFKAEVYRIASGLTNEIDVVTEVLTPYSSGDLNMVSDDGLTMYAVVFMDIDIDSAMDMVPEIKSNVNSDILDVWVTGGIPIFYDMNVYSEKDLQRAEMVAFPVILLVLIVVFGSLIAASLPLIMGVVSVVVTAALVFLLTQTTDVSVFVLNIATFLGLGVSVDYSLLFVNRFREELQKRDVADAIGVTFSTAGQSILFSAVTSILGLSGLLFFDFMVLRSVGIGGVTVMILALLLAMTLLPALIAVLGERVNSLRIIKTGNITEGLWIKLASSVMKRPLIVIVSLTTILVLLGTPYLGVKLGVPWASILPEKAESRQGFDILEKELGPGETSPIMLVYTSPSSPLSEENLQAMYETTNVLANDPRVERVESIVNVAPEITIDNYVKMYQNISNIQDPRILGMLDVMTSDNAAYIKVVPRYEIMADESRDLVELIRSLSYLQGDMTLYVTGGTADLVDAVDAIYGSFPMVILYVLVTIYIALFLLFRSVLLPIKAVLMNGMSIFASYGALVLIFQQGYFQDFLGFTALGYIDAILPVMLFCIIFGLSMDYEVFLLSRIKEIYDETGDNTYSVAQGLEKTGRIITSAALVMVMVCASFAMADIVIVKMFGVGLGLAIIIDVTIVRAILVPALMCVMGRLNWWAPKFVRDFGKN
jgi:RND superfamily putative drug exporter